MPMLLLPCVKFVQLLLISSTKLSELVRKTAGKEETQTINKTVALTCTALLIWKLTGSPVVSISLGW